MCFIPVLFRCLLSKSFYVTLSALWTSSPQSFRRGSSTKTFEDDVQSILFEGDLNPYDVL